ILVLRTLADRESLLEASPGVRDAQGLEEQPRIIADGEFGVEETGTLGDPDVLDTAAAAVVDEHRDRMLPLPVAERDRHRFLAAAGVRVVPAIPDERRADVPRPRRFGHVLGRDARRGLVRGLAQFR